MKTTNGIVNNETFLLEEEYDHSADIEAEMLKAEEQLENYLKLESCRNLDITTINPKRHSPSASKGSPKKLVTGLKIASLEYEHTSEKDENEFDLENDPAAGSKALLSYFSLLGTLNNTEDIDVNFLDVLCTLGDVNITDVHGQSLLHEVAREWSTSVANYLVIKGIDINIQDKWGRTPLFVATAANYPEMVTWLVNNGANIHQKTLLGEKQAPIHYAAKYNAIEVFELLVELGADPVQRDGSGRTPFYIAAESGNAKICECLLDWELPTLSYTVRGEATIDHIINNIPTDLAWRALDQFIVEYKTSMDAKVRVYLDGLGKRRWRLLQKKNAYGLGILTPLNPLEIIIKRDESNLINHPVILEFIKLKGAHFGNRWSKVNIVLHILFTLLWAICASIRVNEFDEPDHIPAGETTKLTVMVFASAAQLLTFVYIYKLYCEWVGLKKLETMEKIRIRQEYTRLKPFCHPRWKQELETLSNQLDAANNTPRQFWSGEGIYIELTCLSFSCVYFVITLVWYIFERIGRNTKLREARMMFSIIFLIVVFLRLNRCFQSFQSLGPFINMIGESMRCGVQIFFLFFEFFVPFSVAFWVVFGGNLIQEEEVYQTFPNMLYQLWLMSFVGDYEYDALSVVNKLMAQILVSFYFVLLSIITINIYVALLSEAFARVNETASERAYMAQARFMQNIEVIWPDYKRNLEWYMSKHCAPMEVSRDKYFGMYKINEENPRGLLKDIERDMLTVSGAVKKIADNEMTFKKDIQEIGEKLREMNAKYGKEKVRTAVGDISKLFSTQSKPLVRVFTKANNGFVRFVNKITDVSRK